MGLHLLLFLLSKKTVYQIPGCFCLNIFRRMSVTRCLENAWAGLFFFLLSKISETIIKPLNLLKAEKEEM